MRKIKFLTATAVVLQSLAVAATPAFAGVVSTETVGGKETPSSASMVAECTKVLAGHPAAARFYATVGSVSYTEVAGDPVESERVRTQISEGGVLGGESLYGPYKNAGAADLSVVEEPTSTTTTGNGKGKGGGKPDTAGNAGGNYNLFAQLNYTNQTLPEYNDTWNVAVTTTFTAVFHCDIRNKTGNLAGAEWQVYDKSLPAGSQTVTTYYSETTGGGTEEIAPVPAADPYVICNRPNGEWKSQNGYTGELGTCSDETFIATTEVLNDI